MDEILLSCNKSTIFFVEQHLWVALNWSSFNLLSYCYTFFQVAILDGFTMGSGAGIAVPGMFRVATNKTVSDQCYRLTSE
jgi:hypothetical protein